MTRCFVSSLIITAAMSLTGCGAVADSIVSGILGDDSDRRKKRYREDGKSKKEAERYASGDSFGYETGY
jgi:hypothetical protein